MNFRPSKFNFINIWMLAAFSLILIGNGDRAMAQEADKQIIIGESVSLDSRLLNEKREILIYRPQSYDPDYKKYPVVYLLDAEYQFHYVTGVVAFLSEIGHIPELIVVGITNTDRDRDLTPEPGEDERKRFPTSGGADQFLKFLDEALIPFVGTRYRTQPFRILMGWSLGGLFSIHALLSRPEIFDAYVVMSPSLYWNGQMEITRAERLLGQKTSFDETLFMTMGDEREERVEGARGFSEVLGKYGIPNFTWNYEPMANETHSSIKLKSVYRGLEFIFSDLRFVEGIGDTGFEDYHRKLVRKYGPDMRLSQDFLFNAYNSFWEKERFEDAVDTAEVFAKEYPESFAGATFQFIRAGKELMDKNEYACAIGLYSLLAGANDRNFTAFKGLGDASFALGKNEAALEYYRRALELKPEDVYIQEQIAKLRKQRQTDFEY